MENMKSWDDWFRQCGERASDVKEYEDEVFALLDKIYPKDKETKDRILFNPLNKNFYEKDVKSYNKKFINGKIAVWSFIVFIFGLLDNCIAKGIINLKDTGGGVSAFFSGFPKGLVAGLITGIISAVVLIAVVNGIKILMIQSRINKLNKKAEELEEFLKLVPPKYRNYECLTFISALFFEYPYLTFSQAIDNCDSFIREHRTRNIRGVLYDVPYGSVSLESSNNNIYSQNSENRSSNTEEETSNNPNLPPDIASKKFMGSDDAQKDLNAMIGLESVKSQIDRLKNRIQFYGADSGNSGNHMVFMGSAGTGKAQPLYSRILTPKGYINMGDVNIGQEVFTHNGNIGKVVGIFPQGKRDIYEITLQDKTKIRVSDEHLNCVYSYNSKTKQNDEMVLTTTELIEKFKNQKGRKKLRIKQPTVDFEPQDVMIHPYLLGVLIGDGNLNQSNGAHKLGFSNSESDIIDKVNSILLAEYEMRLCKSHEHDYRITYLNPTKHSGTRGNRELHPIKRNYDVLSTLKGQLAHYNLLCKSVDKHIPTEYLYNTTEVRLQLLQGLFDTDGNISNNSTTFSTSSKQLSEDFAFLVRSLGIRDTVTTKLPSYTNGVGNKVKGNIAYIHYLSIPNNIPFCTSQKHLSKPHKRQSPGIRKIVSIDYIGKEECQCIMVDHEDHTYISDDFIPTHNTMTARIITKILYDFGYISKNQCVEIDGDYLKSPYVGQTGERTSAIVDYAMGGVLFIDEAYLLYDKNSASAEATGVLLKAMEDRRKDFVVILAGYEEQMTKLLASNEGFASRIKHKIIFPDYTVDEMYQIFNLFLNNYRPNTVYIIEDDAKKLLLKSFELEKKSKSFGNARTVRNAVDYIMEYHADRMVSEQRKSDTNQITIDDIQPYFDLRNKELKQDIRNSSAGDLVDESIIRLSDLKIRMKEGSSEPEAEIRGLIGLDDIKTQLESISKEKEFYGEVNAQLNFTFNGSDDTVKSKMASILTGLLYKLGYIRENRYLDISSEFLKGSYVGHTSRRTDAILNYATGGVLYIRNIGLLSDPQSADTFSQEALSILSSNNVEDLTIIIDDTNDKISQFMSRNPDMKNKISYNMIFPDYTPNQQLQIFNGMAKQSGFTVEEPCLKPLQDYFEKQNKPSAQFVYEYFNEIKRKHINNYVGEENKFIFSMSDFNFNTSSEPRKFKIKMGGKS